MKELKLLEIFYKKLYSSETNPSDSNIESFLENIVIPKLNGEQVLVLGSPISMVELH